MSSYEVIQPASALIGDALERSIEDMEPVVVGFVDNVTPLRPNKSLAYRPVDQLGNARQLDRIKREKSLLQRRRQKRLAQLKVIFSNQPALLKTIAHIEVMEAKLPQLAPNSVEAQTLYFEKSLIAAMANLPLAYVEADTLSWQIDSLNGLIADLIKLTTRLEANDPAVVAHNAKLHGFIQEKDSLWLALTDQEKALRRHSRLQQAEKQLKQWTTLVTTPQV